MRNQYDFALKTRLKKLNPDLSKRYAGCMSLFENMLKRYMIHLPTLSSLIRLADEMDTCSDRNPDILYDNYLNELHSSYSKIHTKKHKSLKMIGIDSDEVEIYSTNEYPEVYGFILETINGIYKKLNYAKEVTQKYGPFTIGQNQLVLHYEGKEDIRVFTKH